MAAHQMQSLPSFGLDNTERYFAALSTGLRENKFNRRGNWGGLLSLAPADVYAFSFVGDTEAVVRRAFDLARSAAPCALFFDELDAILGSDERSTGGHGMTRGTSTEARVLSTFLNEMDGVDGSWKDGVLDSWRYQSALLLLR
jgi:hypothetical protein